MSDSEDDISTSSTSTAVRGSETMVTGSKTFEELGVCEPLVLACQQMGFTKPTQIQQESIPMALAGRDIIGLAQTGSGKTAAFAIPILQSLLDNPAPLFGLVLAPTRELAIQISEQFEALGSTIGVKCVVIVGGMDAMAQAILLSKRPHIVIGTPGRIVFHLENTNGFSLKSIKYLVLDEADRLLNSEFEEDINKIVSLAPKQRNTFLFSATMTTKVKKLQRASLTNPVKVEVDTKYTTVQTLTQNYIFIPAKYKDCYLVYLLNEYAGNSIIIFTTTCNSAMRVSLLLRNLGFGAIPLHGQMTQPSRLGALNKFKSKTRSILVATDVASRGLDIPHVDLILNFDIPTNSKDYIHRVGRTARAGRGGRSISFVTQYDVELFQRIEALIGKQLELYPTEEESVLVFLERVGEAQRYAAMELKETKELKGKRKRPEEEEDDTEEAAGTKYKKHASAGKSGKPKAKPGKGGKFK